MATRRRDDSGFTLVELMVVVVLLTAVMGTLLTVVIRQQRFYTGAAELMETRSQLRQGASILPVELRGVAARYVDGAGSQQSDIISMSPTSLEFRTTVASSMICTTDGATVVTLPPEVLANGSVLTSFVSPVEQNDIAYVYDDGPAAGNADDRWFETTVASIATGNALVCPPESGFTTVADASELRYTVTFTGALPATVVPGAPIRFARRVRYSLYESPTDSREYLGYQVWNGGAFTTIEPVAGPFLAGNGVAFTYLDQSDVEITANDIVARQAVRRIRLAVRGETVRLVRGDSGPGAHVRDSLNVSIALRNR